MTALPQTDSKPTTQSNIAQATAQATAPRAVLYARISRADRNDDGTLDTAGVDRQIDKLRALAQQRGLVIVKEIIENDVSASKGPTRLGFTEMLRLIESGAAEVVVAFGVDRLARRRKDLAVLLDTASRQGIDFVLLNGADIAASTPAGRLVASMMGAVATAETETMGLRLSEAYEARAKKGTHVPRQRTFGYQKGNIEADPEEAAIVREIFTRIADGDPINGIARDLAQRGIVSTKGQAMSRQSIRVIATNPRYAGLCEYRRVTRDEQGREVARPLVMTTDGQWEALVDRELFDAVQEILLDPRRQQERTTVRHLLSGIARCGVCGDALVAGRANKKVMIQCKGFHVGRTAARIEQAISDLAVARLASNAGEVLAASQPGNPLGELGALESRRVTLGQMFAEGSLDADAYAAASKALTAKIAEAKAAALVTVDPFEGFPMGEDAEAIQKAWDAADITARRRIVKHLFDIEVMPVGKGRHADALAGITVTAR